MLQDFRWDRSERPEAQHLSYTQRLKFSVSRIAVRASAFAAGVARKCVPVNIGAVVDRLLKLPRVGRWLMRRARVVINRRWRRIRKAMSKRAKRCAEKAARRQAWLQTLQRNADLLALEPRVVFDAAAAATADQAVDQVAEQQAADAQANQTTRDDGTSESDRQQEAEAAAGMEPGTQRNEIAFVDGSLENIDELLEGIDPAVEIVMLDQNQDGVGQISAALQDRQDVDAIHILSHGDRGKLFVGNSVLDAASMQGEYFNQLTAVGNALSADGDILVYGCNFTGGEAGLEAAILLGSITGADIAASTDETGAAEFGGDWDLETEVGTVEADTIAVPTAKVLLPPDRTPIVDLDSRARPGDADRDWSATFTEGDTPVSVTDTDADVNDRRDDDITNMTIVVAGVADGSSEEADIGGQVFDLSLDGSATTTVDGTTFDIVYVAASGTFTVTNNTGATDPMPDADLDTLIRSITYENTDPGPTAGDRTLAFTVTDLGGNTSSTATSTITVAPLPAISINDVTVNEAAGTATFTVSLSNPSATAVTVDYDTNSGTATEGADFDDTNGTLTFAPGVTTQTVTVNITDDSLFENAEAFSVDLTNVSATATIADNQGIGTIRDDGTGAGGTDDDTPTLTVSAPAVTEGTDAHAVFTVSLSNASTEAITTSLALTAGTATGAGTDFGPAIEVSTDGGATWGAATSVTIPAGATSVMARTPITDDTIDEAAETFDLTATVTAGTTTNGAASGTATITDDDPTPAISINDVTVNEAAGTATFTVSLSNPSATAVTVDYDTNSGTATEGADFDDTNGTLTFAPGVTTQTVTVNITDDSLFENAEAFSVDLTNVSATATIADNQGIGTIRDDGTGAGGTDDDTPTLTVSAPAVTEGTDAHAVFTVSLSNASTEAITTSLALTAGTATGAGTDFGPAIEVSTDGGATWGAATSVTIPAGATSVMARTPITDDTIDEAAETFDLTATVTAGTTTNGAASGTATITDDDPTPAISINDVTVNEAAGTATFTVSLSNPSATAVTVDYDTNSGTATEGADFDDTNGTLTFAPGVTTQTVTVNITDDSLFENAEAFSVDLTNVSATATIADNQGIGTIRDDGTGAGGTDDDTPTLTVSAPAVTEGTDAHAVFTVSLSNASTEAITTSLALTAGTATGAGTDFGPAIEVSTDGGATWGAATSVTIPAGATSVMARTPITDDTIDEAAETFDLTATVTAGTTTNGAASGTATITDDDPTPAISINDVTVNEAAGTATFTVSLSNPSATAVTVDYDTNSGTATEGADFDDTNGTLTFAPGVTTQTVTVNITDDSLFENAEAFSVDLTNVSATATIADNQGIGTIRDDGTGAGGTDDDTPTLTVSAPAVTEGTDAHAVFTVSLSNASTEAITTSLALTAGTATGAGTDFGPAIEVSTDGGATWGAATSVTIPAGATSVMARTPITDDTIDEAAETFDLTATVTAGTTTNGAASGTATITDDDPTPAISINDVTVNEAAGTATFTVSLSNPSATAVTVDYDTNSGTATEGADFDDTNGTLTFAPGVTTQTVTVNITDDSLFENAEAFSVDLTNVSATATIADNQGIGTIRDDGTGAGGTDDDTPTLTVSAPAVTEGTDAHAVFTVSLSNASTEAITTSLALTAGTATGAGTDFGPAIEVSTDGGATWGAATSVTIPAGATSVMARTPITDDTIDEAAETFDLTATVTAGTTTNGAASGTATITDDDPTPAISINDVTVNEAAGTATFTVSLSNPSATAVTVDYDTNSGTATEGADFDDTNGTLTFAPGVTTQTVTVNITDDSLFENAEAFSVDLTNVSATATIADNQGIGTIRDDGTGAGGTDDDTPTLTVSAPAVTEGTDAHAVFTVSLSNASTEAITTSLALTAGTATGAGTDFGPAIEVSTDGGATWGAATSVTIPAGATSVMARTPITDDTIDEAAETFDLTATVTAGTTTNGAASGTATITDDDPTPAISINDVTVNEAAGTATFTVSLSNPSATAVTVDYDTNSGTATEGADFDDTNGTLTFAPGVTTQTVTVNITDDSLFENAEAFSVDLTNVSATATIADNQGIGTIRDDGTGAGGTDDDTPTLTVSAPAVTEGTDAHAVFTVSLSNASTEAITTSLALTAGTATGAGTDFGPAIEVSTDGGATWGAATSVTIPAGATSVMARTPITDDTIDEAAETFDLTATVTAGTTTNGAASGTATITDDDPTPAISINDVTVNEAAGTATFTVSLSNPSATAVTVDYDTNSGTATEGADFDDTNGTLTFAPGVTTQTVTVNITDDSLFENAEAFSVDLTNVSATATIADNQGIGTIRDDGTGAGGTDDDTPTLTVSAPAVTEGTDAHAVFTVSLSNASTEAITTSLALTAGTATGAGTDFGPAIEVSTDGGATWGAATSVTIPAGATSVMARTPITDDTIDEAAETFDLTATVTAGTTTNGAASGTATITDDDPTPAISINDVTVNEAAGTATFTVSLSNPSATAVTVDYDTNSGTATEGADFDDTNGTLTFAPGVTTQTVTVNITDDSLFENAEAFSVDLTNVSATATIADNQGIGTIRDDGTGAGGTDDDTPTLTVSAPAVTEGTDAHAVFTVSLSNASTEAITTSLALTAGTATGAGTDFGPAIEVSTDGGATWGAATSVTIPAGATSVMARTPITDDTIDEAAETFDLTATVTAGTTTNGAASGTATITDDDPTPAISINDVTVNEAAGTATFTVSLSNPSATAVTVDYDTNSGTATEGADFDDTNGTLTFAPGVTTQTVTVNITDDSLFENAEAFSVDLTNVSATATIADNQGIGTIRDDGTGAGGTDDDTPTLTVSAPAVTEGTDAHAVFTVSLSNASTEAITTSLALTAGTATGAGTDFGPAIEVSTDGGATWGAATSVTIPAGATSVMARTPITDDTIDEAAETFDLTATVTAGTTTNGAASGTATITDDDPIGDNDDNDDNDDNETETTGTIFEQLLPPPPTAHVEPARDGGSNGNSVGNVDGNDGIILETVRAIDSTDVAPAAIGTDGIVVSAVNNIGDLGGIASLPGDNRPTVGYVHDVEKLRALAQSAERAFGHGFGHWDAQGVTGFSLRFDVPGIEATGDSARTGQIIVDTILGDHLLFIEITYSLNNETHGTISEYRVLQADGRPLPHWVQQASSGLLLAEIPVDARQLDLQIIALLEDGRSVEQKVVIKTPSGEIQSLPSNDQDAAARSLDAQLNSAAMRDAEAIRALKGAINGASPE